MTHILVTNDDGVSSPGLLALKRALEPYGRVSVIAPDANRSAIGRGITIHNPLHVEEVGPEEATGLTVVFLHGYTQELAVWHYQRQAFAADNPGRLVFYDHRSHGRGGGMVKCCRSRLATSLLTNAGPCRNIS